MVIAVALSKVGSLELWSAGQPRARQGDRSDSRRYNGVIMMDTVAAQYPADSHGFVYWPTWFTRVGPDVDVSASVDGGYYFVSGY